MIQGLYAATSGMVANFQRQLIIANNLANALTPGYKQDISAASDFSNFFIVEQGVDGPNVSAEVGSLGTGTELDDIRLDLTQGDLVETGNPLDLAISGPGYFVVQTPNGVRYTRDGSFYRDALGRLVKADGALVLGQNGPISVGDGDVLVEGDGAVVVDGELVDHLRIADFGPEMIMYKLGNNYFLPADTNAQELAPRGTVVNQGFLEQSNVDVTRAMVEMMAAMRSYEASQKMVQLQDQTLEQAVNDIARV